VTVIPERRVRALVASRDARVLHVTGYTVPAMLPGTQRESRTYYVSK
jgi:hypothetical protein